jgi:hypothetical protein
LFLFLKGGDKNNPSNYRTIMISPLLVTLYVIILEDRLMTRKGAKDQLELGAITKPFFFFAFLSLKTFEKMLYVNIISKFRKASEKKKIEI